MAARKRSSSSSSVIQYLQSNWRLPSSGGEYRIANMTAAGSSGNSAVIDRPSEDWESEAAVCLSINQPRNQREGGRENTYYLKAEAEVRSCSFLAGAAAIPVSSKQDISRSAGDSRRQAGWLEA
jgi:hypothetical protein